ncbi:MAG TPA: PIN domain-containing protein [Verrucomicrobiae bacterium]
MTTDAAIRMNYIFVDYENVQEVDLDLIAGKAVKVFLVVGQRRKTLPSLLARQILHYHDQVTWIESEGATTNALDLVLAYHVGLQAKADPKGYFHILARDKDYDALIMHLRANNILASRDDAFASIPALVAMKSLSLEERVKWVVGRFQKNKTSRPKRKKSLLTTIHSFCRKELSDEEIQEIVTAMVTKKLIELPAQGEIVYQL